MKTRATALVACLLLLSGIAGTASAQEAVTVTLTINTHTVQDTLRPQDVVQIRGAIRGHDWENDTYLDQVIRWNNQSTLVAENIGGDYWTVSWQILPGDTLEYKVWTGFSLDPEQGTNVNGGWEPADNRLLIVPADQEEDIVLPIAYYNRERRFADAPEDHLAVYFRVNLGAQVALGDFDPNNENHRVGMRGQPEGVLYQLDWGETLVYLQREPQPNTRNHFYGGVIYVHEDSLGRNNGNQMYKFVFETPSLNWESTPDRPLHLSQAADTTVHWVFFSGQRPPVGETVTASVQFTVHMGVLEDLGFFDQGVGDEVLLLGSFPPWQWDSGDDRAPMAFQDVFGVFDKSVQVTRSPGDRLEYKYFVRWHSSRFDETSPNYIPGLDQGMGWEEPGLFGGGNRIYEFTDDAEQFAGEFGGTVGFFNSIPPQGVISETRSGNDEMPVTFKVDMTPALTWPGHNFNPAEDDVYIQFEVPFFALTQGLVTGLPGIEANPERLRLSPSDDGDNIYELTMNVQLPTENHIGFNIVYGDLEGEITTSGGGFEPGRRYYRYVTPVSVNGGENIVWPDAYELAVAAFAGEGQASFETPPAYGLDVSTEDGSVLPNQISLDQNYPNPFNPATTISYALSQPSEVSLTVYNMLGQRVATLVDGHQVTGAHNVRFNGADLASGVYMYRLQVDGQVMTRKMVLMK